MMLTMPPISENASMLATSLEGIRILDFTQIASGPCCTQLLADMGADVIKVEPPTGDIGRTLGPPWLDGTGATFLTLNRNKRGIVLDLKTSDGVASAIDLARGCHVVVENFRPGVMQRLGVGYEALKKQNPALVYCGISAYGQTGPWSGKAGVDGVVQAVSGLMSLTGEANSGPVKVQAPVVDIVTGFLATSAILGALRIAERTRVGQLIDVSMFDCSLMLQQIAFGSYLISGETPKRCGSAAPYAAPNEAFPTADGWIMIAAYQDDRFKVLCATLGLSELVGDPRYAELKDRVANRATLFAYLAAELSTKTTDAWIEIFDRVDVLCAPIAEYDRIAGMDLLNERAVLVATPNAARENLHLMGTSFLGKPATVPLRYAPPALGEHTAEVLGSLQSEKIVGTTGV